MITEDITKTINERGDSSYFDSEFADWVSKHYDVYTGAVTHMIRVEAQDMLNDGRFSRRRNQWGLATQQACLNILNWLFTAHEYMVDVTDLKDLAMFVESHRQACVWAVLTGKRGKDN